MRAILAVLLCTTLAVAGCTSNGGGGGDEGDETSTTSGTSTRSASGTRSQTGSSGTGTSTGPGSADNQPPTAQLTASTPGGALPLRVNFTLDGTDDDGDALSWSLDFGDGSAMENGTTLPANASHEFAAAGQYNVTLNVTDGQAFDVSQVTLDVTAGGTGAGQVAEMAWDIGFTNQVGQTAGPPYLDCEDGPNKTFNYDSFTLDLATRGQPFKATISAVSGDASIQSWRVYFNLEDCSDFAGGPFSATGAADITGTVPTDAGAYVFVMATGGFLLESTYQSGSQITA